MASSSSAPEYRPFSGIEPSHQRKNVSESSKLYDVFINHRGPDVKDTLALQLYESLKKLKIRAFLDSREKEIGDSFISTIKNAVQSAAVHIAIFSKRYAESAWCLEELVLMLESGAKIIPLFYGVEPSALRHIEKGVYEEAFIHKYEEKKRYMDKINEWKKALNKVSFIAGEVIKNFSDWDCEKIVSTVRKEIERKRPLIVAKHPVGLPELARDFEKQSMVKLVQDFEGQCEMNKERKGGKARITGLFGMGGVGKSTLSKELFNRNRSDYSRSCFLLDVREASLNGRLPSLQMQLVNDLFDQDHPGFSDIEHGKSYLTSCFARPHNSKFLIVLDDVDDQTQLDALLFSKEINESEDGLVIVTTRDEGVLIAANISFRYNMKGLDRDHAKELFCWHAFSQSYPCPGYEELAYLFVDACCGLPLSLQVLGSHVHGRDKKFWELELDKINEMLPREIQKRLKISIDMLEYQEKQIFMDIACFFIGEIKRDAIIVWTASGWKAEHALTRLKDKCLVQEEKEPYDHWNSRGLYNVPREERFVLRMHDHLRDLGREMADEVKGPRRLWRPEHLQSLTSKGLKNFFTQPQHRCLASFSHPSGNFFIKFFQGKSDNWAETSTTVVWLELELKVCKKIPAEIPLQNLIILRITNGEMKNLWQGRLQVPFLLKELQIFQISGLEELNLGPLRCLQRVTITYCHYLKRVTGIVDHMELVEFDIAKCRELEKFGYNKVSYVKKSRISRLVKLNIEECAQLYEINFAHLNELLTLELTAEIVELQLGEISSAHLNRLEKIKNSSCGKLRTLEGTTDLRKLVHLQITPWPFLRKKRFDDLSCVEKISISGTSLVKVIIPDLRELVELNFDHCRNLKEIIFLHLSCLKKLTVTSCYELKSLGGPSGLRKLVELQITACSVLEEFCLLYPSCVERIKIDRCSQLKSLGGASDLRKLVELQISECPELEEFCLLYPSCVERIKIDGCSKLKSLGGSSDQRKLVELQISYCPELEEFCLPYPSCLERIKIDRCSKLKRLGGTSDLRKLVELQISGYPGLEEFCRSYLSCVERTKINDCSILKSLGGLKRLIGPFALRDLVEFEIDRCAQLEVIRPVELGCLEKIMISRCSKLRSVTLFHFMKLRELNFSGCRQIEELSLVQVSSLEKFLNFYPFNPMINQVEGCESESSFVTLKTSKLDFWDCPKLNIKLTLRHCRKLPTVTGMDYSADSPEVQFEKLCFYPRLIRWLEIIGIDSCEKMQKITGIERLQSLERVQLLYFSRATIQNFILKMEKLPSEFLQLIGRPKDGAESTLNAKLFCDGNVGFNSVIEFGSDDKCTEDSATAIILCEVFVIDTPLAAEQINSIMSECHCDLWQKFEMRQGKWIITCVTTNQDEVHSYICNRGYVFPFEGFLDGLVRKEYKMTVTMKNSEKPKILHVLRKIVDELYF